MVTPGTAAEFLIFYRLCQKTDSVFLLFLLLSQISLLPTLLWRWGEGGSSYFLFPVLNVVSVWLLLVLVAACRIFSLRCCVRDL